MWNLSCRFVSSISAKLTPLKKGKMKAKLLATVFSAFAIVLNSNADQISVGLEDPDDLWQRLQRALETS